MKKQDTLEKVANYVYLSIGSNIGDRIYNIEKSKGLLIKENITILNNSSLYETPSWPNSKFPKFLNIILLIKTSFEIDKLFLKLKKIELIMGRKKSKKNWPRICDIDIIDFNNETSLNICGKQKVIVPHQRMHNRNFVLFPLFELNKSWKHPKTGKKISQLLSKLSIKSIRSIKVI